MIYFEAVTLSTIRSGKGDCIHLRFIGDSGVPRNLIIDTGPPSSAGEFRRLVSSIRANDEQLDILIITHYDDDHIGGILKTGDPGFQDIYFNAYNGAAEESENLSAVQNQRLFHMLPTAKVHSSVLAGDMIKLDGAKITVIAPNTDTLLRARQKMREEDGQFTGVQLASVADWNMSLDELMNKPYPSMDTSIANQASIVFAFEYGSQKFLFCGDSWAKNIPSGHFDMVKMPHHGSIRNISDDLLSRLDADAFLICADGTSHPNKQTIAKLMQKYGRITIYSNYSWWLNEFLQQEDKKYVSNGQLIFKCV